MIMEEQIPTQHSIREANLSISIGNATAGSLNIDSTRICAVVPDDSRCCNVYVANLPSSADAAVIRRLFEPVGRVLHVKLLLDIASGVSRGIAFVMFENIEVAQKACAAINKVVLDGKVLQVRQAERSSLHSSPTSHVRSTVVYIRNVPGNIGKDQVRDYCSANFGPVIEVSPHPQSAELKGPSPYNMDFVVFHTVEAACACVEAIDGRATFPMPQGHPFTMAKMITDVGGEMRKSILLRRRSSENAGAAKTQSAKRPDSRRTSAFPSPASPHIQVSPAQSHLPVNPHFQPFAHQYQQPQGYTQPPPMAPMYHQVPLVQSRPSGYDGQLNAPYFDNSVSQRSSMDTSMLQSQRGSLFMNGPNYQQQTYLGPVVAEQRPPVSHYPIQGQPHTTYAYGTPQLMQQYPVGPQPVAQAAIPIGQHQQMIYVPVAYQ